MIRRKDEFDTGVFGLFLDLQCFLKHIVLDERLSYSKTFGLEKGVCHRAADEKLIDLSLDKRFDHRDLVRHLRPAKDGDERPLGIIQCASKKIEFLFHQKTGYLVFHIVCDAFGRGMCPVSGAEGVVHVNVAKRGELLGEFRIVLFLPGMKTQILEKQHLSVLQL